jgi:mRNA interferase HigB
MRIVALRTLREFWQRDPKAEGPMRFWHQTVGRANWQTPADIKATFNSVDLRPRNRAIFDVGGNKYRIVVVYLLKSQMIYIRFVGTHEEYDRIDVDMV